MKEDISWLRGQQILLGAFKLEKISLLRYTWWISCERQLSLDTIMRQKRTHKGH